MNPGKSLKTILSRILSINPWINPGVRVNSETHRTVFNGFTKTNIESYSCCTKQWTVIKKQ